MTPRLPVVVRTGYRRWPTQEGQRDQATSEGIDALRDVAGSGERLARLALLPD